MTKPLVTIGIPTYNRANTYLRTAVESALSQTYVNIEIVVSDNYSEDDTEMVVREFCDDRIRYHRHNKNIGPNNNFNFCLEMARGDYFLLLHDDDLIDSDFIDACMKAVDYSTEFGIIRTGTRLIDSEGVIKKEILNLASCTSTEEFFMDWFTSKTAFYLCSTLFNTKKLKIIGGFESPNNLFQDVFAEVRLASEYGHAEVIGVKASFREHAEERTFLVKIEAWCEDSLALVELMCSLVGDDNEQIDDIISRLEDIKYL